MLKEIKGKYPIVDADAFVAESAYVIGNVELGRKSSVWFGSILRGDVGSIKIGEYTNIQDATIIHMDHGNRVLIGDGVTIGHRCTIHGCEIMGDAIIGMETTILDNVVIGRNAMIGAGSLVTPGKVVGEGELWMGRPAKFARMLTQEELDYIRFLAKNYYENSLMYRGEV
ncbi:MAG TPA: gamma carbonic anhydrase family protein [Clostridiaceae bacterium]|nr:gamma carbonic anhydrase family protein [Clostridiaceae bacterium]